jgi:hypothetical protein
MKDRPKARYIVDLPKHLAVCEGNYHRILKLMPDLQKNRDEAPTQQWRYAISGFNDKAETKGLELCIVIAEVAKYTTMINVCVTPSPLVVCDVGVDEPINPPDSDNNLLAVLASYSLDVRLYHDAQLAEVVSSRGCRQFAARHEYPNQQMHQRDEKAQLNQFLSELIGFCLVKGRVAYKVMSV